MTCRPLLFGLIATAMAAPLLSQTRTVDLDTVTDAQPVDGTTQTEDVAFADDDFERMTVAVRLSGTGPYRFLVDTGADRTAVSRELVDRLKLAPAGRARLHSVSGSGPVDMATLPSLELADKQIRVAGAPILSETHMGADGILGVDALRAQRVQFDFKARTMSIVPSAEYVARDADEIVVRARQRNGRLVLTKARAAGHSVSVVVDTGSQISVGNDALRQKLFRRPRAGEFERIALRSVTGEQLVGDYVILKRLEIGGATLTNVAIVFASAHTFKQLGLDKKPAMLLGMNAMRAFDRVSIDFANKKLRLLMPEHGQLDGATFASRAGR